MMRWATEHLKAAVRSAWYFRSRFPRLDFAVTCRLPNGDRFRAHGDAMGWLVFNRRLPFTGQPYESDVQRFLTRYLQPGMVFLDVGANQGLFTLIAAKLVGTTGQVIAFEPAPSELARLRANVALNGYRNVACEPMAVGEGNGETDYYVCQYGRASFSGRKLAADVAQFRPLPMRAPLVSLDQYFATQRIGRCDLIKIDVEGGELSVLQGATSVLARLQPSIVLEAAEIRTAPWGYSPRALAEYLNQLGYGVFGLNSTGEAEPITWKQLDAMRFENLLALPSRLAEATCSPK